MELRGQDKEIVMPRSLSYNPPNDRDSSSRTLDQHQSLCHHHQQQLNPQYQAHKPTRDLDLIPDPAPATTPIATKTSTTSTAPTPSKSISRSPPITSTPSSSITYRECLKNHAASMGGHVVDGCGEFMPTADESTLEALKCAACGCHRNFHRKEVDGESKYAANISHYKNSNGQRNTLPPPHHQLLVTSHPPPQPSIHRHHRYPHGSINAYTAPIAPMMMGFGGGGVAAESSSEDLNIYQSDLHGQTSMQPSMSKKRFRTKFSHDQKDKMMEFAEKLGWRIQKQDEQEVQQFCSQVGVKRKVFKVWMHNNKQAMKKKQM